MLLRNSIEKRFLLLNFFLFLACQALAQNTIMVDTTHYKIIRVDPSNAVGANVSDVFDNVNYIPLETKAESVFGKINQLEVIDNYYVILDYDTNCILIFSKAGKFHAKIKAGDNPNDKVWRFIVNRWTNQIVYSTNSYKNFFYYDLNGKLVRTLDVKSLKTSEINLFTGYFVARDKILSYMPYYKINPLGKGTSLSSRSLLQFANEDGSVFSTAFPYSASEAKIDAITTGIGPLTYFGNDTTFFFSKVFAYSIYTVTPNSVKVSYKFAFPINNSLPEDFLSNEGNNGKRINFIKQHDDVIYCLNNFYQIGSNLLFEASKNLANKEDNLIYGLKSGNLIAYKHISPDERSFFLPIYDDMSSNFENLGLGACDGQYLYTSVSSLRMFQAKVASENKNVKYNQVLSQYFRGSKNDNPVILQLKIKSEL